MDSMYSMYGPYMSCYGYDSYGYGTYKQTPSWYKTMGYGFSGYGKENVAGLDELNRGPRAKGFKIGQESPQPETLDIEKKTVKMFLFQILRTTTRKISLKPTLMRNCLLSNHTVKMIFTKASNTMCGQAPPMATRSLMLHIMRLKRSQTGPVLFF